MIVDKAKLGKRYTCFQCGTKFYDLMRETSACPECGADQENAPKIDMRALLAGRGRVRAADEDEDDTPSLDLDSKSDDDDDFDGLGLDDDDDDGDDGDDDDDDGDDD